MPLATSEEMIVESPIVERERTHLGAEEHALLKQLLAPGADIDAVIPPDADPDEMWKILGACAHGLNMLEARSTRVSFIIGKILTAFESKPSLYKHLGYDTWSDFMRQGVEEHLGLRHSAAYVVRKTVMNWPQLTPDRYAEIGPKKMEVLNKFTNGRSSNAEAWLDTAKRMKVPEFKQYVEQRGLLAPGEATGATFTIPTNQNRYALFKAFFADGRVQSLVGSRDADRILEAAIQECFDEWIARYEERRAEERRSKAE